MASVVPNKINSILIVDDDEDSLDMYKSLLGKITGANIITSEYPSKALLLAKEKLFDLIAIDVTMDFNGSPFGGLDLYRSLLKRYGSSSIIAYSQYITDDLLRRYDNDFNFIKKIPNAVKFIEKLLAAFIALRKNQKCFIAMPFANNYDKLFKLINKCINKCGYKTIRVDQQVFTNSIIEKVLNEIVESKLVIFVATDKNPNAFYECGYSVAQDKEVITITDYYENLPFDIRDRNAIAYYNDPPGMADELVNRISCITKI